MTLRNFWLEARIDGRKTELTGGPRAKEGGISLTIYQRENGSKTEAVKINCYEYKGELTTAITLHGNVVGIYTTRR